MKIGLLNEKVTFQKNSVSVDRIGNRINIWEDYYTCYATIGGEGLASSKEKENAGTVVEDVTMTVTVRFCKMTAELTSIRCRVVFHGEIYDVTDIDHMNFRKKCLKFTCRKVRR